MDAVLQGQHSISLPLVVASNLSATAGGIVASSSYDLIDFLREQAERDEEKETEGSNREG